MILHGFRGFFFGPVQWLFSTVKSSINNAKYPFVVVLCGTAVSVRGEIGIRAIGEESEHGVSFDGKGNGRIGSCVCGY